MSLMHAPLPEPDDSDAAFSPQESISGTLEKMAQSYRQNTRVSIDELLQKLHHRGFALLMLVLVLPNCVPVPIPPGGSTLFSLPLFFIALQMIWGRNTPWLPGWLRRKSFEQSLMDKIVRIAAPRLRWVERFMKPRYRFTSGKTGERVVGFFWLLFTLSIAIPLPMTNFLPGVGILVMSLGMLERDGVVVGIGAAIGLFGVAVTTLLLTLGVEAIRALFPFLF